MPASTNIFLTGGSTPDPRAGPKPKEVMGILKKHYLNILIISGNA